MKRSTFLTTRRWALLLAGMLLIAGNGIAQLQPDAPVKGKKVTQAERQAAADRAAAVASPSRRWGR